MSRIRIELKRRMVRLVGRTAPSPISSGNSCLNAICYNYSMESPQGLNGEILKSSVEPIIEYDPSLQKEEVPYKVHVDSEKCTELFREFGISDEAIRKFKIKIKRKPLFKRSPVGEYSSRNGDAITIYADVLWKRLQSQEQKTKSPFEKGVAFVQKISGGEYGTPVGLFLHESKHASDFKGKIAKVLGVGFQFTYYLGGAIGVGVAIDRSIPLVPLNDLLSPLALFSVPVLYAANPYEIRARRFASKNRNDPRWQNILTITSKENK